MLGTLRSKRNNPVIVMLLGFVVVLMAGFGVTISGGDGGQWAAKVEGEKIAYADFARTYGRAFQNRQQRDRGYDRSRAEAENLRKLVLDQMIWTKLLAIEAKSRGLLVGDDALRDAIQVIEAFHDDSGRFDPATYERALRAGRTNPVSFEADFREDLLANQLRTVVQGVGPSEAELRARWEEDETKVSVRFVKVPDDAFSFEVGTVTEADVEAWAKAVEDPEAAVLEFYRAKKATRYDVPKQVCARHILVKSPPDMPPDVRAQHREKLGEAADAIEGGLAFSEAAAKYSEDSTKDRGGDLGCFGPGQMVPPFEEAAFALEPGQRSGIVESPFGIHLIEVYDVKAPIRQKLETVQAEIRRELTEVARAKELAQAFARSVLDAARGAGGLEPGLEAVRAGREGAPLPALEVEKTEPFNRTQAFLPKLGLAQAVVRAAFALSEERPFPDAPVPVDGGFVVLGFAERDQPDPSKYEDAKRMLSYRLTLEKQEAVAERLLAGMKERYRVEVNDAAISYDDDLRARAFRRADL